MTVSMLARMIMLGLGMGGGVAGGWSAYGWLQAAMSDLAVRPEVAVPQVRGAALHWNGAGYVTIAAPQALTLVQVRTVLLR